MHILALSPGQTLARDETLRMETEELAAGARTPLSRHPDSDAVYLFYEGSGEITTADRVHRFTSTRHAHVSAGVAYQIVNTGQGPLRFVRALCPHGPTVTVDHPDHKARPGGVTLLSIDQYDRFPDSGLVRGGMFFLDVGKTATYHSHDAAAEVFVFLRGECDATVEGETARVKPGEVLYVPAELKHTLVNVGNDKLVVWLTVTPNVTPTHTFYEPLPDGTWKRVTPRVDGRPVRAPSR